MEDTEKKELAPEIQRQVAEIGKKVIAEVEKESVDELALQRLSDEMDTVLGEPKKGKHGAVVTCPHCGDEIKIGLLD